MAVVEKIDKGIDELYTDLLMYEMKEHEIRRNKKYCMWKIIVLHILLFLFFIYLNRDFVKSKIKKLQKGEEQNG